MRIREWLTGSPSHAELDYKVTIFPKTHGTSSKKLDVRSIYGSLEGETSPLGQKEVVYSSTPASQADLVARIGTLVGDISCLRSSVTSQTEEIKSLLYSAAIRQQSIKLQLTRLATLLWLLIILAFLPWVPLTVGLINEYLEGLPPLTRSSGPISGGYE